MMVTRQDVTARGMKVDSIKIVVSSFGHFWMVIHNVIELDQFDEAKKLTQHLLQQVIGMDACSGAGCSWSCKNILGCSESPKMM